MAKNNITVSYDVNEGFKTNQGYYSYANSIFHVNRVKWWCTRL